MKSKLNKILCPIDFSAAYINAMDYTAKLSKQLGASLTLWNMCEIPIIDEIDSNTDSPNLIGKKQQELVEIVQDWCEEIKEEYAIPCGYFGVSNTDNLKHKLARYTDGENFDLIIAGTNGLNNMYQFFFGANGFNIVKEAKCPVIIIPEGYPSKKIDSIVFATDYSLKDAQLAKGLVRIFDANITFLRLRKKENEISKETFQTFKKLIEEEVGKDYLIDFERLVHNEIDGVVEKMIEKDADMVVLSNKQKRRDTD